MSSYIVDDITINRIISFIYHENDGFLKPDINRILQKLKIYGNDEEVLKKIAIKMLKTNIGATSQRYNNKLSKEEYNRINVFIPSVDVPKKLRSKPQTYNSLRCLTYQMSEGNIPKTKMFKVLEKLENCLAISLANEVTEKEKCIWG